MIHFKCSLEASDKKCNKTLAGLATTLVWLQIIILLTVGSKVSTFRTNDHIHVSSEHARGLYQFPSEQYSQFPLIQTFRDYRFIKIYISLAE